MSDDSVIFLFILVIFLAFGIWMAILLIQQFNEGTVTSPRAQILQCEVDQCATNIQSGSKRCPEPGQKILVNPYSEVCNDRYFCNNSLTPFALQGDGSTNNYGICEEGIECPCLTKAQCPNYIVSYFSTQGGNPYTSLPGQRITFPQTFSNNRPIILGDYSTDFCTISSSWLPYSNPGCNFISYTDSIDPTIDDITTCMGGAVGCNGNYSNPCLQGTLSFLTNNPDSFTADQSIYTPLACVAGDPCPCGQVALFDTNSETIVCRKLN